ncbi:thiamine pyrophosphate-binding protein [Streptomyces sp. NBC_01281]|uniref:thiamine pyrophosphate-binding protein n=1 Tax=unclassified Streptomyces TaxID=2593676 RepID=UPI0022585874|nr:MULTISPECIES: thiamine pyrophosphate-binding protein [unclassified Streptomyces]MCX5134908.1 thiamine pyrophosphate-binding protein [Streptomyces sp. NBC_00340]WSK59264.1 thiamine pyrophosphate-binding protein [Streptomyces sp. NBC_01281]
MTTVTAAEALVTQLESYGVEYVFGTCGHTNIALLDALGPSPIHFVIARHEQAAAHAADGYARASGKPGVLLTHVGPGMMNAVTGVATAAMDSVPLIVISGDIPSYYYGRHPHQEVNLHADADQTAIYRPFCKRAWPVQRTADLPRTLERAFWTATSGRPGAVLVNVPMDLFSRQVEPYTPGTHAIPDSALPGLTEETAERIAQALVNAERPLIYFGGGLRTPEAKQALLALAEHLDIPLAHSLMGKGAIPDRHPLLLGMPGFWGLDSTHAHTKDADVVLALATRFAETDASSWEAAYTWNFPPSKLIQIDIDPAEIGRNYPVEIGAVADVGHSVRAIGAAVRALQPAPTRRPGLREAIATSRAELFQNADENGASDNFPLRPQRILADLRASLPADTILVTDVGWNKNGVAQSYDLPPQGRFITPGGASTMGFGPAAAVGVQMAQPQRTVVALIGDGGMSAQLPAVPMAVEQGLPVIFAVMNNRAHGTISDLQRSNYGRGYGCDFTGPDGRPYSPDFAAYGRSCGADGYEVATAEDLAKVISTAVERRRPAVIDIPMVNEPVPTPGHWNINDIYQGTFQDEG